jgi:hypothetical protein
MPHLRRSLFMHHRPGLSWSTGPHIGTDTTGIVATERTRRPRFGPPSCLAWLRHKKPGVCELPSFSLTTEGPHAAAVTRGGWDKGGLGMGCRWSLCQTRSRSPAWKTISSALLSPTILQSRTCQSPPSVANAIQSSTSMPLPATGAGSNKPQLHPQEQDDSPPMRLRRGLSRELHALDSAAVVSG